MHIGQVLELTCDRLALEGKVCDVDGGKLMRGYRDCLISVCHTFGTHACPCPLEGHQKRLELVEGRPCAVVSNQQCLSSFRRPCMPMCNMNRDPAQGVHGTCLHRVIGTFTCMGPLVLAPAPHVNACAKGVMPCSFALGTLSTCCCTPMLRCGLLQGVCLVPPLQLCIGYLFTFRCIPMLRLCLSQGVCLAPPSNFVVLCDRALPGERLVAEIASIKKGGAGSEAGARALLILSRQGVCVNCVSVPLCCHGMARTHTTGQPI